MESWMLVILGAALAGGLLVLNGFAVCKEAAADVLDLYQLTLENAIPTQTPSKPKNVRESDQPHAADDAD